MKNICLKYLCLIFFLSSVLGFAQGDGPRSFILLPKDVWAVNARWLGMDQKINPTGTILVPKAEVEVNVFPITLYRTFSIARRFAQVSVMVNPGSVSGYAKDELLGLRLL